MRAAGNVDDGISHLVPVHTDRHPPPSDTERRGRNVQSKRDRLALYQSCGKHRLDKKKRRFDQPRDDLFYGSGIAHELKDVDDTCDTRVKI